MGNYLCVPCPAAQMTPSHPRARFEWPLGMFIRGSIPVSSPDPAQLWPSDLRRNVGAYSNAPIHEHAQRPFQPFVCKRCPPRAAGHVRQREHSGQFPDPAQLWPSDLRMNIGAYSNAPIHEHAQRPSPPLVRKRRPPRAAGHGTRHSSQPPGNHHHKRPPHPINN